MILGIDPGPTQSAYLWLIDGAPRDFGIEPNTELLSMLRRRGPETNDAVLVVEWVSFYGKEIHAGSETFDTCFVAGRFMEAWSEDDKARLIPRRVVRTELCGTAKAGDKEVRAVLIDRYGGKEKAIGRKAERGPLYGIASHCWSALAVATVYADQQEQAKRRTA